MSLERAVIVGGGIIGTMHALQACDRGWEVIHIEADAGPRRASVRNFGLVWVSGRAPGPELELALRARHLWGEIAQRSPAVGFRADGSVTVAASDSELALMAELAAQPDASSRMVELLDANGVRSVNPVIKGDILGGLWCRADAVVEPGAVLGSLRAVLEATGRYHWVPGRQAVDVQTSSASASASASGSGSGSGSSTASPTVIDHEGGRHQGSLA